MFLLKYTQIIFLIIVLSSMHSFSKTTIAQVRNQIFVGTRPLSMGEAFVAVADDGNAIYWNPAGLARMERIQASFNYADLFGLGINSYYASFISRLYFIPPLTDYLTFGVDWFRIQTGDDELDFTRDQLNFSLALRPPKSLPVMRDFSFGLNAKYLQLGSKLDGNTEADSDGWGWDFGLLYNLSALRIFPKGLNFGIMVHDVTGTSVKHKSGLDEEILRQNIRWGFSYRPFEDWPGGKAPISAPVFALDFDDRVHFGLEFWLANVMALRAGIQKDLHTDEKATLSFGLGFRLTSKNIPETTVDYALTDSPVLPNTNKQFGGSLIFRNDPRLIRVEGAHIDDVFSSLYLHYGKPDAKIGTIKLKNVSKDTLRARIAFEEDRYLESQKADTVDIAPEIPVHVPLRAVFKPEIFDATGGRLTAKVKVTYTHKRSEFSTVAALDFELYEKNFLTWDDPVKAAAFVTYDDADVKKFVDAALERKPDVLKEHWFSRYKMADALAIFNAMKTYGFIYRRDPVTPFPLLTDYRPDKISYPAQLLRKQQTAERAGDCDDLSVLYASLLQNAGISTALVSEPTHLFMMFDTGISATERQALPILPSRFVSYNGNLWIPIDAAQIPNLSFTEAWQKGVDKFKEAEIDTFFEVALSQKKYPAPKLNLAPGWRPTISDYTLELEKDLSSLSDLQKDYFQAIANVVARKGLSKPEKIKARNFYGAVLGQNNDYDRAKEQFQQILADSSTYAPAWNNLANIEFILGNFAQSEQLYHKALDNALFSHGIYVNLAILYQMMLEGASVEDSVLYQRKSDAAIEQAARLFRADTESAFTLLGFPKESTDGKAGGIIDTIKSTIKKVKKFIDRGFKKYASKKGPQKVALDRGGSKADGEIDEERWAVLWWSY